MKLTLVDIHDTDADHEVGGQDLPNLVTVNVEGASVQDVLAKHPFAALEPFNVQESKHLGLPGHVEFCTFSFADDIQRFFGVEPEKSADDVAFEKYCRRAYVRTVGELRAAIADLPDDFPLVHTGRKCNPDRTVEYFNALGVQVQTGTWIFTGPGLPTWGEPRWSLRVDGFDPGDWAKVMDGSWRNITAADLKG